MVISKNDGGNSPLPNFKLVVSLCVKNMCYNFVFSVGHVCTDFFFHPQEVKLGLFATLKANANFIILKSDLCLDFCVAVVRLSN